VFRVLPNLVEVRYFTTPTPALENYEHWLPWRGTVYTVP